MTLAYVLIVGILCFLLSIMWHHRDTLNLILKLVFSGISIWSLVIFLQMIL